MQGWLLDTVQLPRLLGALVSGVLVSVRSAIGQDIKTRQGGT